MHILPLRSILKVNNRRNCDLGRCLFCEHQDDHDPFCPHDAADPARQTRWHNGFFDGVRGWRRHKNAEYILGFKQGIVYTMRRIQPKGSFVPVSVIKPSLRTENGTYVREIQEIPIGWYYSIVSLSTIYGRGKVKLNMRFRIHPGDLIKSYLMDTQTIHLPDGRHREVYNHWLFSAPAPFKVKMLWDMNARGTKVDQDTRDAIRHVLPEMTAEPVTKALVFY